MPVYNKENPDYFRTALDSIWHRQTLKPNEIVVVKDGPLTDALDLVLNKFSEIAPVKIVALKHNVGIGEALSRGVLECSYEYIARMDSDDVAFPERFEKQMWYLKQHPKVGILSSWIDEFIDDTTNVVSTRKVPEKHAEIVHQLKSRSPFNHPAVVFKKEAVIKSGNYRPYYLKEDVYLWLRLFSNNIIFANINESLLFFRTSKDTYKRRGGVKYAQSEFNLLRYGYKIHLTNGFEFLFYTALIIPIRLAPTSIRAFIYTKILR